MVEQPELDAWNVGYALTTSGQPLQASLTCQNWQGSL
jgi:hypothetical protein